jgi:hypothetical protein
MGTLRGGVAVVDITPAPGLALSGFGARTLPSTGVHDRLTARALVLGDTAIVVADVIGMHEAMSERIRRRCALPAGNVIVAATHTHGAPEPMEGRIGAADAGFLQALEDGCVAAIDAALASAEPVWLSQGLGGDPDVARNRRSANGPVDRSVPVLRFHRQDGSIKAVFFSYACHPTVLGPDNLLITAEFPHFARAAIEAAIPGAVAVFANGCTGDVNIGHSAHASLSLAASDARSFANAERIGNKLAAAVLEAETQRLGDQVLAAERLVELDLERREGDLMARAAEWRAEAETAEPVQQLMLGSWIGWAETYHATDPGTWSGRVSLLGWGGMPIVALPGEIFAETGLSIRTAMGNRPAFVLSYADAVPGYIPAANAYPFGGYEVDEAHRFIGMPGSFASGSAERLADAAMALAANHMGPAV